MRYAVTLILLIACFTNSAWAEKVKYTCPMHPHYIADEPGACPICGMDLVPVAGSDGDSASNALADGERTSVSIAPETIQTIGVRTARAEKARFGTTVRSVGIVEPNQRTQQELSSRVAGWIEDLRIQAVGDTVAKGDVLYRLYSPELISAQKDFTSALAGGARGRIDATRKRLEFLGAQPATLDAIAKSRKVLDKMPFYAETNGTVSHIAVTEGSYVQPGQSIARIQDYSSVWIEASVAEKDIPFIAPDAVAEVGLPNLGNKMLTARVDYIYPTIHANTRTGKVRLVLPNEDGSIRPGAYTDVVFETDPKLRLSVPTESILHDGNGAHVVVAIGEGKFTPRTIVTGITSQGRTEIVAGLQEGETIVVSSQFLIDSESALRESLTKMQRQQQPLATLPLTQDQLAMVNHFVDAAIYLHETLVGNERFNPRMLDPALQLNAHLLRNFHETALEPIIDQATKAIHKAAESITKSEQQEALAELMRALDPWLMEGRPQYYKEKGLYLFTSLPSKSRWLQLDETASNPYDEEESMLQAWPEISAAPMNRDEAPISSEAPAFIGGGHAGH